LSVGNIIVWIVWIAAAAACIGSALAVVALRNALYLGAGADRQPDLAGGLLPAALGRVRRRRAGADLRRRVMVMFLFVIAYVGWDKDIAWTGGPRWQTLGVWSPRRRCSASWSS